MKQSEAEDDEERASKVEEQGGRVGWDWMDAL